MKEEYKEISSKMEKTLTALDNEFKAIRAGRASAAVLDRIFVDYYGAQTPVNQLASISSPEARQLVIQPYDASALKNIEKAILVSDIGINPQNDGKTIRLIFPPLTEERRRDLVKDVKRIGEDSKVTIRSIRRDALEKFKADKKNNVMTEDDLKAAEKDIQDLTDKFCKTIDSTVSAKEKEILEI